MKTTVIAEIGSNWETLDDILYSCEWAVHRNLLPKLQLWKTDLVVNDAYHPKMYQVMQSYELPQEWVRKINQNFPETFYSVFDLESLEFLKNEIKPKYYKIASPDCVFKPLVKAVASIGTPTFVSVGGATLDEIRDCAREFDWQKLTLMSCVVDYPCRDAELWYLRDRILGSRLIPWGYSSHSRSKIVPALAVALGATAIECHFSLKSFNCPDYSHSFTPGEFDDIIANITETEQNLGNSERPLACEKRHLSLGRRKEDGRR